MATPPRLGRGDPVPSHIRWIHEDVLQLLGNVVSKVLPKQPDPFELSRTLVKNLYVIIGLQIVTAILLLIVIIK